MLKIEIKYALLTFFNVNSENVLGITISPYISNYYLSNI